MKSLKYEIVQMVKEMDHRKVHKGGKIAPKTARQYRHLAVQYGEWCKQRYGCRHPQDCKAHIQDYADWLTAEGKSASTIHTYLAAVCRVWGCAAGCHQQTQAGHRRQLPQPGNESCGLAG